MENRLLQSIMIERSKKSISKSMLSLLQQLQNEITRLETENTLLRQDHQKSRVEIINHVSEKSIYIPEDKNIRFYLGEYKHKNQSELYLDIRINNDKLQIMGSRAITIFPNCSNVAHIGFVD